MDGKLVIDPGTYQAGACNIGPAEIARRRRGAVIGLAATVLLGIGLVAIGAPAIARLLVFPPLAGALIGFEQARRHFCVGFAMAGLRNFGPLGSPDRITDGADLARDRRAGLVIVAYCSAIAAVVTLLFAALPI
ncbi:MAG TPA: hypothetical protein VFI69_07005 [Candidatus Limnocylindrales bacterium]|jgi:hypothetical protein|nr:hypothetical protein [Candidatus Limnocylindrales bacterium]